MKAFKVFYDTGGKQNSMTVLVDDEMNLEQAIANKDKDFRVGNRWSKINNKQELPLSNVLISELSVTELLDLLKKN